jgi:hypothetical protein
MDEAGWWAALSPTVRDGLAHVVDVAATLLRLANATPAATSVDFRDAALAPESDRVRAAVLARLPDEPTEFVDGETVTGLAAALAIGRLRPGLTALIGAHVLDAWAGHRYIDYFRGDRQRLQVGDPLPVIGFPAATLPTPAQKDVLRALGQPTSRPSNLTPHDDRSPRLRLAPPEVARFRVGLRWAEPHLDPITPEWRFAVAATNRVVVDEFSWQRYRHGDRSLFYEVAPRDLAQQRERLHAAIDEAVRRRATVLVLPELCATHALADELTASDRLAHLPLVALGSFHETTAPATPGRNRCRVLARGVELTTHDKFSDFHLEDEGDTPDDPAVRRHEHLIADDAVAGFDLLIAATNAVVVLICKDALDTRVAALVQELAPTVVLVPAMSPKTRPFETLAERLADVPQAFTVVAVVTEEHAAIFGRPGSKRPDAPPVTKRTCAEPKVFVFDLGGQETD